MRKSYADMRKAYGKVMRKAGKKKEGKKKEKRRKNRRIEKEG